MSYPEVHWITNGKDGSDHRPAIASDGQTILFERRAASERTLLYRMVAGSGNDPVPFLPGLAGEQTRPDWWKKDVVAFNVSDNHGVSVYTVGSGGKHWAEVPGSAHFLYPQWDAAGDSLTIMNKSTSANPRPCSSVIKKDGTILYSNVNGNDGRKPLFGGMPAVNPTKHADNIAFAGQPSWDGSDYSQDDNYIFLNQGSGGTYFSAPMESGAGIDSFDARFQGRAPAWSPDGRYIAFESNRNNGYALFLFDTNNPLKGAAQLTDPKANPAMHAKWYPDGVCLIFSAQSPSHPDNDGIAWILIKQYLS